MNLTNRILYGTKTTRLLTYKELNWACYNTSAAINSGGGLNNCNFLFENTKYSKLANSTNGSWLESPDNYSNNRVDYISPGTRNVKNNFTLNALGVRPVIELDKKYIEY